MIHQTPVWEATLDKRYRCVVVRDVNDPYVGELVVIDTQGNAELLREVVGIMYGAQFGPDIDDVTAWQDRCAEVVDGAR